MLSGKNLDILIKNLSLEEFASVSQELADRDEKLMMAEQFIIGIKDGTIKADLNEVLDTFVKIFDLEV